MAPKRKQPTKRRKKTASCEAVVEKQKESTREPDSRLLCKMKIVMDSVQKGYTHQAKNIGTEIIIT